MPIDKESNKIHTARLHVFSDQVLCPSTGAMNDLCGMWKTKPISFSDIVPFLNKLEFRDSQQCSLQGGRADSRLVSTLAQHEVVGPVRSPEITYFCGLPGWTFTCSTKMSESSWVCRGDNQYPCQICVRNWFSQIARLSSS